jgi:ComF family protein
MLSRLLQRTRQLTAQLPAILPSTCALCGVAGSDTLCPGCRKQYVVPRGACCAQCAMPLTGGAAQRCGACLDDAPAYDATVAAVDYGAPLDQLVLALKFGGRLALAPLFAQLMRDALLHAPQAPLPDLLLPVPLGEQRLVSRGFNQALEIARPLSHALGIKLEARATLRLRETDAQSTLHPEQRRKNMRGAFSVAPAFVGKLDGLHVGVIDDVMTTGETMNELAATLKRFGAARVTNFVFARTLLK